MKQGVTSLLVCVVGTLLLMSFVLWAAKHLATASVSTGLLFLAYLAYRFGRTGVKGRQ